jgi:hypothetical protein
MKLNGPFEIELKVFITDGEQQGQVTYTLPSGLYPTVEMIRSALATSEQKAKEAVGADFRLFSKREFFDHLIREKTGSSERFAMSGSEEWDGAEDESRP